jgi:hypothetical protein
MCRTDCFNIKHFAVMPTVLYISYGYWNKLRLFKQRQLITGCKSKAVCLVSRRNWSHVLGSGADLINVQEEVFIFAATGLATSAQICRRTCTYNSVCKYRVSLLWCAWPRRLLGDVQEDAGFLCHNFAKLGGQDKRDTVYTGLI